ncbi:MAG: elongation factor 4 [Spirochaetales bacterium]|nr:elongation factor 4 [Spirochaetales bacterium]
MPHPVHLIRNFCIIAHIDHGKSTLADRFIQRSKIIDDRNFQNQLLDNMDIERERGITIKSQAVALPHLAADGQRYMLNLVDTPGHADFSYEVSRAIASSEGALLVIDATQGVQAQTLSNLYMAMEHDLFIIPVINKIDMPGADIERVKHQIDHDLGLDSSIAVCVSAKIGLGMDELLQAIVDWIPPPNGQADQPPQAVIFDSHYDPFRGVIVHVRNFQGTLKEGDEVRLWNSNATHILEEVGVFRITLERTKALGPGEVGYFIAGIKNISDVRVGDTVTSLANPCSASLPGFRDVKPVVFSSLYPVDSDQYEELSKALEKLKLNDASLIYEKDSSAALGFGFKCGFLGLLHLEVVQERLEREFDLNIILTSPSVQYRLTSKKGQVYTIESPANFPDPTTIEVAEEPYIKATIITPADYLGSIMTLCTNKRGVQENMTYLDEKRVEMRYSMPLAEVLFDFYDKMKSISKGYASFDYELSGFQVTDLVKLDIMINGETVDALSMLVFRGNAYDRARRVCEKLKDEIPRQQFKIAIQGSIGNSIIARETVQAFRKDVLAKCYGGDISRKRKLLEKQKEGKKRMKMVGSVELPQSAFLSVLKSGDDD